MSNFLKKSFLISMVVMTVFGLGGFGSLQVNVADAAAMPGDLIKSSSSPAVYYLDSNNVKHPFHHSREYFTWYSDFSDVMVIPTDEMVSYSLGSTIVVRPGSKLVQYVEVLGDGTWNVSNSPEVYAVGMEGTLHHVTSADVAVALYGADWETMIVPLPNYLSANYTNGSALTADSMYPSGTLVKTADSTQIYYVDGSSKRPVTSEGFSANRFNFDFVVTTDDLTAYSDGSSITAYEAEISDPVAGDAGTPAGSGVTVALAAGNPGAQVVPIGATSVELMKINLTAASDGAVTVDEIVVNRAGVGADADWSNLYLYEGASRLTSGKSINSTSHKATFNNLNLSVAAGSTKTLSLRGDVMCTGACDGTSDATAGNMHYFTIASGDIDSSATVNGSFPLSSNTTTIGSVVAGTITIAENGSLSGPSIGDSNAKIAQFTLVAGSSEDVVLNRLSLYQAGSINNGYLTNLKLYQDSTLIGSVASINSKSLIVFDLATSPYTLAKNQTRTFYVTADISTSARANDTTKIYLDQSSDLFAVGGAYGYGVTVTSTSYDGGDTSCTSESECDDSTYLAIQGGEVTVSNNGPVSTSYAVNDDNLVMLEFAVTSAVPMEIRSWRVELHNDSTDLDTDTAGDIDDILNVRIEATDGSFSSDSKDATTFTEINGSNNGLYATYSDTLSFDAGESKTFQILMDTDANIPTTGNYYVVLGSSVSGSSYTFSSTSIRGENNQYITDIVPSSSISGSDMTLSSASLTTALGNFTGDQDVVKGATNTELLYYTLTAGTASDIEVSQIQFAGFIDDDDAGTGEFSQDDAGNDVYVQDVVNNFKLYEKNGDTYTQIGNAEGISSGLITFDSLTYEIPAGSSKTIVLKGDISASAYLNSNAENVAFEILTGGITASYGSGTSLGSVTANKNHATATATLDTAFTMSTFQARTSINNSGTLTVDAPNNPVSANAVAGTSGVDVLDLVFNAATENFNIEKFRLYQSIPGNNGGNRAISGISITYPIDAEGTTRTVSNGIVPSSTIGYVDFNLAEPIFVPANGTAEVDVKANLSAITANATQAKTGDQFKFELDHTAANFRAVSSGVTTTVSGTNATDEVGNIMTLRKAIPTFTMVDLDSESLVIGTANDIYKFRVTASQGSSIDLKKVPLQVNLVGTGAAKASLSLDNIVIVEEGDPNLLTEGDTVASGHYRVYEGSASTATAANILSDNLVYANSLLSTTAGVPNWGAQNAYLVFNDDRTISASANKVYTISGSVEVTSGSPTNGANYSVSVNLRAADTSVATSVLGYLEPYCATTSEAAAYSKYCLAVAAGTSDTAAYYIWSDHSGTAGNNQHVDMATGHTGSSGDWTNGYLLKTLGETTRFTKSVSFPN